MPAQLNVIGYPALPFLPSLAALSALPALPPTGTAPTFSAVILTLPRLYALSALPFTPVTGVPARTSHLPSSVLYTLAPAGIVFPAPSLKSEVVTNWSEMLYILPLVVADSAGRLANATVPIGLNAPENDSEIRLACS